jgi:hypothetical protein
MADKEEHQIQSEIVATEDEEEDEETPNDKGSMSIKMKLQQFFLQDIF